MFASNPCFDLTDKLNEETGEPEPLSDLEDDFVPLEPTEVPKQESSLPKKPHHVEQLDISDVLGKEEKKETWTKLNDKFEVLESSSEERELEKPTQQPEQQQEKQIPDSVQKRMEEMDELD